MIDLSHVVQGLVAKTRQHPTYKQGYDLPAYQEGWALSKRGAVSDAPARTRVLSVDCEMCKAEGNAKELIRLSVVDQDLKVGSGMAWELLLCLRVECCCDPMDLYH